MKKNIDEEVSKTIESLDSLERAAPKPYFYTRLEGKLTPSKMAPKSVWTWSMASIAIILMVNLYILINYNNDQDLQTEDTLELLSQEYASDDFDIYDNNYIMEEDETN